jgi:uncharacterized YkwD family protein
MKKKLIVLLVLTLVFTSLMGFTGYEFNNGVMAAPQFQRVNYVNAVVTADQLNIREGPGTTYKVVCKLKKGSTVKVFGKLGTWYAVYDPAMGCVGAADSRYVKPAGTQAQGKTAPGKQTNQLPTTNPPKTAKPTPPPDGITAEERELLDLVNKARKDAGAGMLEFDTNVVKVARIKAKDMVDNKYFSHQSPTYGSPFDMLKKFGVTFKAAGENIAGNQTVAGAFKAWMNSPGHKANILNGNFNYCGFGITPSPTYGKMLVQQFIKR